MQVMIIAQIIVEFCEEFSLLGLLNQIVEPAIIESTGLLTGPQGSQRFTLRISEGLGVRLCQCLQCLGGHSSRRISHIDINILPARNRYK